MKHLFLLRHAKSDWYSSAQSDFDRPLNRRGVKDAHKLADYIDSHVLTAENKPDYVMCSSAERTRQTWAILDKTLQLSPSQVSFEDRLYEASTQALFNTIAETTEGIGNLLLIGHNPSFEQLIHHLFPKEPIINGKLLTTANLAHITFKGEWSAFERNNPELLTLIRPKEI